MSLVALVLKELREHAWVALGGVLIAVSLVMAWVSDALDERSIPLLTPVGGALLFVVPFLALLAGSRLVVRERAQGTHEFLAGLPVPPALREGVKFGLGLAYVLAVAWGVLLVAAVGVHRQEVITLGRMVALLAQTGAWSLLCWSLAYSLGQWGSLRLAAWVVVLSAMALVHELEGPLGALGHPFDEHRFAPPWGAMGWAVAWSAGLLGVALTASLWRGGALVAAAWGTPSDRVRSLRQALGVAVLVLVVILEESDTDEDERDWSVLPAVGEAEGLVVRVAAARGSARWQVAEQVQALLAELPLELDESEVVLVGTGRMDGAAALWTLQDGVALIDARADAAVDAVARVSWRGALEDRTSGWLAWEPDRGWLVPGAVGWALGVDEGSAQRAAWSAARIGPDELASFRQVELRLGEDAAAAVAAVGVAVLAERVGPERTWSFLEEAIPHLERPRHLRRMRTDALDALLARTTGWTGTEHRAAWYARLEALEVSHREELSAVPELRARALHRAGGLLEWSLEGGASGHELVWTALDPLHDQPLPAAALESAPLSGTEGSVPIEVDPGRSVAVAVAVEALGGRLRSEWTVLP